MTSICGLEYFGHGRCILVRGHEGRSLSTPHQAADGFCWDRVDEYYTDEDGQVFHDHSDEPVDYARDLVLGMEDFDLSTAEDEGDIDVPGPSQDGR